MKEKAAHTPEPWEWSINPESHSVILQRQAGLRDTVLSFARWGMSGATPLFCVDGILKRAVDLSIPQPGREHHADWFRIINHPDAHLMGAAPELLTACKALLSGHLRISHREDMCEFCIGARAAIAKAEGKKAEGRG